MNLIEFPLIFKKNIFYSPNKILFGIDVSNSLSTEFSELTESKNVLIVTDRNVKALKKFGEILTILKEHEFSITIFDGVEPEPSIATVRRLCSLARELDLGAIAGIGGGSVMDSAKMAAISPTNLKPVDEYVGGNLVEKRGIPLVCIPTTSGTGSEVTRFAIFTLENHNKNTMVSPYIVPNTAIVDPLLTISCPRDITAGAGMDALSHAIEPMISLDATPLTDACALEAIKLIFKYLRRAYFKGEDVESRSYMAIAATLAGISLCNSRVVAAHTISQAFAPLCNMSHGASTGIALPYAVEFYLPVMQRKYAEIAKVTGLAEIGMSERKMAEATVEAVKELARDLGFAISLRECGIGEEQIENIVEIGLRNWPRPYSPIELTKENVRLLVEKMWEGY